MDPVCHRCPDMNVKKTPDVATNAEIVLDRRHPKILQNHGTQPLTKVINIMLQNLNALELLRHLEDVKSEGGG